MRQGVGEAFPPLLSRLMGGLGRPSMAGPSSGRASKGITGRRWRDAQVGHLGRHCYVGATDGCSNGQELQPGLVGGCAQSDTRSFVPLPVRGSGTCSRQHLRLDSGAVLNWWLGGCGWRGRFVSHMCGARLGGIMFRQLVTCSVS
jgi:hypothetical protein